MPHDNLPPENNTPLINLEPGEKILLTLRNHWIVLAEIAIYALIVIALAVGVFFVGEIANIHSIFIILTSLGIIMIGSQYVFVKWVNDELDVLIITNQRIIDYEQIDIFHRKISQTTLDQVQEVGANSSGLLGNIFGYGSVKITTANEASDFDMPHISDALEISRVIHGFVDEHRRKKVIK